MVRKVLVLIAILFLCSTAFADRQLERSEILEIFAALVANPQEAWIQSGTIEAMRTEYKAAQTTDTNEIETQIAEELQTYLESSVKRELTDQLQRLEAEAIPFNVKYRLSNEYTMDSTVIVKVDGDKFYWQIDVNSRTDSVTKPVDLADNYMTREFNLECNEKRVFAWDGASYITYSRPLNHATIEPGRYPVNGPLIAGAIPWGYGSYTLEELTNAESLATEIGTDIRLIITRYDREETFVLDTEKNYAVKQYSSVKQNGKMSVHSCGGYQLINGKWYPGSVLIEKYDASIPPQKLLARDVWNFTSISVVTPTDDSFTVEYEYDAFIEDFSLGGDKPLQYRYSDSELSAKAKVDTDELIKQRLMFASADSRRNCATASLKYVCDNLGVKYPLENLSKIVHGDKNTTSMAQMQQFAENLGLNTIAVKADIETLLLLQKQSSSSFSRRVKSGDLFEIDPSILLCSARNDKEEEKLSQNEMDIKELGQSDAGNYHVIVHLPGKEHFVVLGQTDGQYVRLIDISSNRIYYRRSIDWFNSVWDGKALIIANEKIEGKFAKLDNPEEIVGCCAEDCTELLQDFGILECLITYVPVCMCDFSYEVYYERYGCEVASSGTCSESSMVRYRETPCIDDHGCICDLDGEWTYYYMQACS